MVKSLTKLRCGKEKISSLDTYRTMIQLFGRPRDLGNIVSEV